MSKAVRAGFKPVRTAFLYIRFSSLANAALIFESTAASATSPSSTAFSRSLQAFVTWVEDFLTGEASVSVRAIAPAKSASPEAIALAAIS